MPTNDKEVMGHRQKKIPTKTIMHIGCRVVEASFPQKGYFINERGSSLNSEDRPWLVGWYKRYRLWLAYRCCTPVKNSESTHHLHGAFTVSMWIFVSQSTRQKWIPTKKHILLCFLEQRDSKWSANVAMVTWKIQWQKNAMVTWKIQWQKNGVQTRRIRRQQQNILVA